MIKMIKLFNCKKCGKEFSARVDERQNRNIYCSRQCKGMGWNCKLEHNPKYNGGVTYAEQGYKLVSAPDHPHKTKAGYIREHRLIMEKILGRYLMPGEEVHHINGDKTDNRAENLELIGSRSIHLKIEHKIGTYKNHLLKLNGKICLS